VGRPYNPHCVDCGADSNGFSYCVRCWAQKRAGTGHTRPLRTRLERRRQAKSERAVHLARTRQEAPR
jgi:hypothetical protein